MTKIIWEVERGIAKLKSEDVSWTDLQAIKRMIESMGAMRARFTKEEREDTDY